MTKRLIAIGNSLGIIIEKPILDLLNIDRETDLEIRTDGEAIFLKPIRNSSVRKVLERAGRKMDIHSDTLKKLSK